MRLFKRKSLKFGPFKPEDSVNLNISVIDDVNGSNKIDCIATYQNFLEKWKLHTAADIFKIKFDFRQPLTAKISNICCNLEYSHW